MRVLINLGALIGRLPIGARHSTKSRVISQRFVRGGRALRSPDFHVIECRGFTATLYIRFMAGGAFYTADNYKS
jgi:hypothetical protein